MDKGLYLGSLVPSILSNIVAAATFAYRYADNH